MNDILIELKNKLKELDSELVMYQSLSRHVIMGFNFSVIMKYDLENYIKAVINTFDNIELSNKVVSFLRDIQRGDFPSSDIKGEKYFKTYADICEFDCENTEQFNRDVIVSIKYELIPTCIKYLNYLKVKSINESLDDIAKLDSAKYSKRESDGKLITINFIDVKNTNQIKVIQNYIKLNANDKILKIKILNDNDNEFLQNIIKHIINFIFIVENSNIVKINNTDKTKLFDAIYNTKVLSVFTPFKSEENFKILSANIENEETKKFILKTIEEFYDLLVKPTEVKPTSETPKDETPKVEPESETPKDETSEVKPTSETPKVEQQSEIKTVDLFKEKIVLEICDIFKSYVKNKSIKPSNNEKYKNIVQSFVKDMVTDYQKLIKEITKENISNFNTNTLYVDIKNIDGKVQSYNLTISDTANLKEGDISLTLTIKLDNIIIALNKASDIVKFTYNNKTINELTPHDETVEVETEDIVSENPPKLNPESETPKDETSEVKPTSETPKDETSEVKPTIPSYKIKPENIISKIKELLTNFETMYSTLYSTETNKKLKNNIFYIILKSVIKDKIKQFSINDTVFNAEFDRSENPNFINTLLRVINKTDKVSLKNLPMKTTDIKEVIFLNSIGKATDMCDSATKLYFIDDTQDLLKLPQPNLITGDVIEIVGIYDDILLQIYQAFKSEGEIDKFINKKNVNEKLNKNPFFDIFYYIKNSKTDKIKFNINGTIVEVESNYLETGEIFEAKFKNGSVNKIGFVEDKFKLLSGVESQNILNGDVISIEIIGDNKNQNLIPLLSNIKDLTSPPSKDLIDKLKADIEKVNVILGGKEPNKTLMIDEILSEVIESKYYTLLSNHKIINDFENIKNLIMLNSINYVFKGVNYYTSSIRNKLVELYTNNYVVFNKIIRKNDNGDIIIPKGFTISDSLFCTIINSKEQIKKHRRYMYVQQNDKAVKFIEDNQLSNFIVGINSVIFTDITLLNKVYETISIISNKKYTYNVDYEQSTFTFDLTKNFTSPIKSINELTLPIKVDVSQDFTFYFDNYIQPTNFTTQSFQQYDSIFKETFKKGVNIISEIEKNKNFKAETIKFNWGDTFNLSEFSETIDITDVNWEGAYIEFDLSVIKLMNEIIKNNFKGGYVNIVFENYLNTNQQFEIRDTNSSKAFNWKGENIGEHTKLGQNTKIGYVLSLKKIYKAKLKNLNVTINKINFLQALEEILGNKEIKDSVLLKLFNVDNETKTKIKDKIKEKFSMFGWQFGYVGLKQDETIKAQVKKFIPVTIKLNNISFEYMHTPIYSIGEGINLANLKKLQNSQINGRLWYLNPVFYYGFLPVKNSNANIFVSTIAKKDAGSIFRFMNTIMSYKALQDGGSIQQDEGKNFVKLSTTKEGQKVANPDKRLFLKYFNFIENTFIETNNYDKNKIKTSEKKEDIITQKMNSLILSDEDKQDILKKFILKTLSFFTTKDFQLDKWDDKEISNITINQLKQVDKELNKLPENQQKTYISDAEIDFKMFKNFITELSKAKKTENENKESDKTDEKYGDLPNVKIMQTHKSLDTIIKTIKNTYFADNENEYEKQINILVKFLEVLLEYLNKYFDGDNKQTIESLQVEHFYTTIFKAQGVLDLLGSEVNEFGLLFDKLSASERQIIIDKRQDKNSMIDKFDIRVYIDIQYIKGDLRFTSALLDALNQSGGYF